MKLGLDIDGTITAQPDVFAALAAGWMESGNELHIITGAAGPLATPEEMAVRQAQLSALGFDGLYDQLVIVGVPHDENKAQYCAAVGIDLLIDNDKPNVKAAVAAGIHAARLKGDGCDETGKSMGVYDGLAKCMSCGCGDPDCDHGDSRNITRADLYDAASAAGVSPSDAVNNIAAAQWPEDEAESDEDLVCSVLVKSVDERRFTLGLMYPANRADVGKGVDKYRDFTTPDVLESAAWRWMAKGCEIALVHLDPTNSTTGRGVVVESYIYRGPDWSLQAVDGSEVLIKAGDWLAGAVWDEAAWQDMKDGKLRGWSPEGAVIRRVPDPRSLEQLR